MGTSELSDALNPTYAIPQRNRQPLIQNADQQSPQLQQPQYIPHRSELEHAIAQPPQAPQTLRIPSQQQPPQGVQALLKLVANTHQAAEIERKRRLAWEKEQEAKYAQRQADVERQLLGMRHEIMSLKGILVNSPLVSSESLHVSPSLGPSPLVQSALIPSFHQAHSQHLSFPTPVPGPDTVPSLTPSPSPHLQPAVPAPSTSISKHKKRRKASTPNDSSDSQDDSESSDTGSQRHVRKRRNNHHDHRCMTIHHAMRTHLVKLMGLKNNKELPESYSDDQDWDESDPIRFVWEKTPKQSVHNARMKNRVLAQIKLARDQYSQVPDSEFSKKSLDSAFDQCYTTFRQKFKAQKDSLEAQHLKERERRKSKRSRHTSRRKNKLSNRADARMHISVFEHIAFDGALQIECMSSDDSGSDGEGDMLYSQGYAWRSRRLINMYAALDAQAEKDRASQPKRGVGKRKRITGPLKDGLLLPPKGVAGWMVSQRWLSELNSTRPDIAEQVCKDIEHYDPVVIGTCPLLGEDSDDEARHGYGALAPL